MDENRLSSLPPWPPSDPAPGHQSGWPLEEAATDVPDVEPTSISGVVLKAVLDSVTDGVVVADTEGRFLLFNSAAERMLGLGARGVRSEEWPATYGCYLEDGVTPYPPDRLPLVRAMRGETVHDCQMVIRNPHVMGQIWLSIDGGPVTDEAGVVRGGVVVFRDISAERREIVRLQMLSAAVDQTADCVIITDRQGIIEYVNPAAEAVTGFPARELIGFKPSVFRSNLHPPEFYADMWRTLLLGRPFRGTIVNRRKDGTLYYSEQTITSIRDTSGAISNFVSVGKDVTDRRKAAERESKLQLARMVQQRLLPAAPSHDCGLDISGGAVMADTTGGDFFDFIPLAGRRMGIVVGDVSGHAIDAALVMAQTHAYMRSVARENMNPGRILSLVNQVMLDDVLDGQFVTAVFISVDVAAATLTYASAGHTTGYVLDAAGRVVHAITSTGIPLGLFADATYETTGFSNLDPGSLIVLITDGVVEAENESGIPFGEVRALDAIRACVHAPTADIITQLQDAVRLYSGHGTPGDDVTVVACRVLERP